tara:strand:+ start:2301 stop:3140 length:840 start_codon:yes stop_codon:yes gene_type:complete
MVDLSLLATLGSGLLGAYGSSKVADANTEANAATIQAARENQERGMQGLTGRSDFKDTTRTPEGGFDVSQPGGTDAASARSLGSFGDIARAGKANTLTNMDFKLPTLNDAQQVIDRDIGRRQGSFDKGVTDLMSAQKRNFGGVNSSAEMPTTIDALARFSDANKYNREQDALSLFDKSRSNDLSNVGAQLGNLAPRAAAPAFSSGTPGTAAAQLVAQTPIPSTVASLSSAAPFLGGQSALQDVRNQYNTQQSNKLMNQLISRQLGNQYGGSYTGAGPSL